MSYGPTSTVSRRRSTIASAWVRRVKTAMRTTAFGRTSMAALGSSKLSIRPRENAFECYSKRSNGYDGFSRRMGRGPAKQFRPARLLFVVFELVDNDFSFKSHDGVLDTGESGSHLGPQGLLGLADFGA